MNRKVLLKSIRLMMALTLILASSSCQHVLKNEQLSKKYSDYIGELSTFNNFAFELEGHNYYFAPLQIEENGYRCMYYLGFKDEQLSYQFLSKNLNSLESIYQEKIDIQSKMKKALKQIEIFSTDKTSCRESSGYKYKGQMNEAIENTLTLIVYSPALAISVFFGAGVYIDAVKDNLFESKLNKIRLGLTSHEVQEIFKEKFSISKSENFEIFHLQRKSKDLVFVYKNSVLVAYVWGYARN